MYVSIWYTTRLIEGFPKAYLTLPQRDIWDSGEFYAFPPLSEVIVLLQIKDKLITNKNM